MSTKHVVLTGASRGIGLALTKAFLTAGMRVTATCRHPDGARDLWELESEYPSKLRLLPLDVTDNEQIKTLAQELGSVSVDILINNAGVYPGRVSFAQLGQTDLLQGMKVNAFGPLLVTQALLPHLQRAKGATVVHITSKMGSIGDNDGGGSYAYRMSKAALNMFHKSFAIDYPNLVSLTLHPGWVQTDMGGAQALIDTLTCANGLRDVILQATKKDSGKFYDYRGEEIPW